MNMFTSIETANGYIEYVQRVSGQITQLDPHLDAAMDRIANHSNSIRYTTYRVASKLTMLSKELFMDCVPYKLVIAVLERHGLHHTDSAPLVRPDQLTSLLHDIFYAANISGFFEARTNFALERSVGMLANLLWNIFDQERSTPLSVLELKQTFLLICKPTSYDRIIFEHFLLASDHNACVSRFRFESLIVVMAKIFAHIDPLPMFDHSSTLVRPFFVLPLTQLLEDCFAQCPGLVGLNKFQFYTLWRRSPSGLVSFGHFANVQALIGRMSHTKSLEHPRRTCVGCSASPILGLCFRCQQCSKVVLCFSCFGKGYVTAKHGPQHRMYELSSEADESEMNRLRVFIQKLCHLITGKPWALNSESKPHNITLETNVIQIDESNPPSSQSIKTGHSPNVAENDQNVLADVTQRDTLPNDNGLSLSPKGHFTWNSSGRASTLHWETLQNVVDALEKQNLLLSEWLGDRKATSEDFAFLHEHRSTLQSLVTQLQATQQLPRTLSSIQPHSCSTPYQKAKNTNNNNLVELGSLITNSMLSSSSEAAKSIKGNDINRSYLEANRSDLSIGDLSTWLHTRRTTESIRVKRESLPTVEEDENTEMSAFRELLHAVKEILEDSFSDNAELSKVTNQLEAVLGHMIDDVATKRSQFIDTCI